MLSLKLSPVLLCVAAAGLWTANAQVAPLNCFNNGGVPPIMRAEGVAELSSDLVVACTGGVPGALVTTNVSLYLNTLVTNRIMDTVANTTDALLLIDPVSGSPIDAGTVPLHLRKARVTRISIEANSGICRGMLRHRYDTPGQGETFLDPTSEEDR